MVSLVQGDVEICIERGELESLRAFTEVYPNILWVGHNIKFDMHFLAREGITLLRVYDTLVGARLENNTHLEYSLDACAERIGEKKLDTVKEYAEEHDLFTREKIPGKKKIDKRYHFDRVPRAIVREYAVHDSRLALKLYCHQQVVFAQYDSDTRYSVQGLARLEGDVTNVLFAMEWRGVKLDGDFIDGAVRSEEARIDEAKREISEIIQMPFVDSNASLSRAFQSLLIQGGRTAKGNPSFTDDVLEGIDHPLSRRILGYRNANKRLGSFFSSFKYFGKSGRIHPTFRQGGTTTGRFSSSDPNCQQWSDEGDDVAFPVRRSFVPDPGFVFGSLDYQAQEYRLLCDYAEERELIELILSGKDVHQATAEMMGVERRQAKTLNFALLYGAGVEKLAKMLGVSIDEARVLKRKYFKSLPNVRAFIDRVVRTAETRGFIFNRYGRRYFYPDPRWAYKAPNHLIQGTGSDVMRTALVACHEFLKPHETHILLSIHDEIVFQVHESELYLIPGLVKIMEGAYPYKHLPLRVGAKISRKSLCKADMEDFIETTGDEVQRAGS